VGYRFFALPHHRLTGDWGGPLTDELFEPEVSRATEVIEQALAGAELRSMRARDRLRQLLTGDSPPFGSPGESCGRSALLASPPEDLPALLRLADQLDSMARDEAGERALVWRCECGTRYAVPLNLVRPVAIRCERCGNPVQLTVSKSEGEESLLDPFQGTVNRSRRQLAAFFREAMARGWPVLVCISE
jgi:hypothetical protein